MTLDSTTAQRAQSPCTQVCSLDAAQMCIGCGRTLAEIAAWSRMSYAEQLAVCSVAAERLSAVRMSASNS